MCILHVYTTTSFFTLSHINEAYSRLKKAVINITLFVTIFLKFFFLNWYLISTFK